MGKIKVPHFFMDNPVLNSEGILTAAETGAAFSTTPCGWQISKSATATITTVTMIMTTMTIFGFGLTSISYFKPGGKCDVEK